LVTDWVWERQWGGTEWRIDWNLGPFNHDLGHHVGDIGWEVASAVASGRKDDDASSAAIEVLAKRHSIHEKSFRVDWEELVTAKLLVQDPGGQVPRKYGDGTRMVRAKVRKRSNGKIRVADVRKNGGEDE